MAQISAGTLRQRNTKKDPLTIVRSLDAFPKIPDEYKVGTRIGGTLSILSRLLIVVLVILEIQWYRDRELVFKFLPDTSMDAKLKIHIDITVATECRAIGADIMDQTSQNVFSFGMLQEEDTWWEMCPKQREHFEFVQTMNTYLREEWHSLTHLIMKSISTDHHYNAASAANHPPERSSKPTHPFDACRIHGDLTLNKVAGNFHVIGGKSMQFPRGHVHITPLLEDDRMNFSHRIHRFGFGDAALVNPLEGDEKIFSRGSTIAQYFIEVVPTEIKTLMSTVSTYQYSVKENIRPIDHDTGSHGIPGLYFKYDMSALKIAVEPNRDNLFYLTVRLGSVISGIVVLSGVLNALLQKLLVLAVQLWNPEVAAAQRRKSVPSAAPTVAAGSSMTSNLLLNAAVPDGYVCEVATVPLSGISGGAKSYSK